MDASSNDAKFFGNDNAKRMETLRFIDSFEGLRHPLKLSDVAGQTQSYAAVFVPGGHAPMVDLVRDKDLGKILLSFHETRRPTALICHGPMALLSTLPQTETFDKALNAGDMASSPGLGARLALCGLQDCRVLESRRTANRTTAARRPRTLL